MSAVVGDIPEEVATTAACLARQAALQPTAALVASVQSEAAAVREAATKAVAKAAASANEAASDQQAPRGDATDQGMGGDLDLADDEVAQVIALDENTGVAATFSTDEARRKLAATFKGFQKVARGAGAKSQSAPKTELVRK